MSQNIQPLSRVLFAPNQGPVDAVQNLLEIMLEARTCPHSEPHYIYIEVAGLGAVVRPQVVGKTREVAKLLWHNPLQEACPANDVAHANVSNHT